MRGGYAVAQRNATADIEAQQVGRVPRIAHTASKVRGVVHTAVREVRRIEHTASTARGVVQTAVREEHLADRERSSAPS